MAHYRLYFIDHLDHIRRAVDVDAADDAEAIGKAQAQNETEVMEVWQGARQVSRLDRPRPTARG